MLSTLISCLFFTTCGFLIRHVMAQTEARRVLAKEAYIVELEVDVAGLAAVIKAERQAANAVLRAQGEEISRLRDEASDSIHECDLLRESLAALKNANASLQILGSKQTSKPATKPSTKANKGVTGKRVRIAK